MNYSDIGFWFIGWILYIRAKFLKNAQPQKLTEKISIIVPARNEEKNLIRLLDSLKTLNCEIIVVNDNSTDNTQALLKNYPDVKAVTLVEEPTDGWAGKTRACWNGYLNATGNLFLFLDADVEFGKEALQSIIAEYIKQGGLISVWPYQRLKKWYEHLVMPFHLIAIASISSEFLWEKTKGAYGPVMFTSRQDYEKVGGHKAVKDSITEDLAIGRLYSNNKIPVTNYLSDGIIKFQMYPENLKQLFEGITKNVSTGALQIGVLKLLAIFLWFTGGYSSFLRFDYKIENLILYFLYVIQFYVITRRTGDFSILDSLLYPFYFIFFLFCFIFSVIRKFLFKNVVWKGRKINV